MTSTSPHCGLYIHIPFCERKCPYCAFHSVPLEGSSPDQLVEALIKEIDRYEITEPLETIYLGGGSPSCLPTEILVGLVEALADRFGAVPEWTMECNPAQADDKLLARLRELGINRLSIGGQSFNAQELKTLGRLHGPDEIARAVSSGRNAGFDNIGLDLIFAVPGSDLSTWQMTVEKAIALDVQHISAYSLTIEKGTPFETRWRSGTPGAVSEPLERSMYELACVQLTKAGYAHYEISNFARKGFECRHNVRYWKNWPVVGVGPSAASWYRGRRTTNIADVNGYVKMMQSGHIIYADEQTPSTEQVAAETAVLNLRMLVGIDLVAYRQQTGFDLKELFPYAIEKNCSLGLLFDTGSHVRLTEVGLSFADSVAADFAAPD